MNRRSRAVCTSNLKQVYTSRVLYSNDYNSLLPVSTGSDVYMQCKYYANSTNWSYGSPQPTGLGHLVERKYLTLEVLACPSRDHNAVQQQAFQGRCYFISKIKPGGKFDYGYRYNQPHQVNLCGQFRFGNWADLGAALLNQPGGYPSGFAAKPTMTPVLAKAGYNKLMLLSDCCEATRPNVMAPGPNDLFPGIWAHKDGGVVAHHNGSVKFYPNHDSGGGSASYHRLSWPSDWIINQARYYQLALDPLTSGQ